MFGTMRSSRSPKPRATSSNPAARTFCNVAPSRCALCRCISTISSAVVPPGSPAPGTAVARRCTDHLRVQGSCVFLRHEASRLTGFGTGDRGHHAGYRQRYCRPGPRSGWPDREGADPPLVEVAAPGGDHRTPFRAIGWRTETQEAERGEGEDRVPEIERPQNHQRRDGAGQDVMDEHAGPGGAECLRSQHEFPVPRGQDQPRTLRA